MIYFVTGGSRGIGAAIVLDAIKHGHQVAFTYLSNADKAKQVVEQAREIAPDLKCKAYQMEVGDSSAVERVGDQVVDDFETVDVVINNAGITKDNLLAYMSDEEWDDVIRTNLTGPFYVCRQFIPTLLANRYGRIINISSLVAGGASGQANYASSKAGLHGLTRVIAKEYGRKNITANALQLGFFDTDMTRETMPQPVKDFWNTYCPRPKGRMGTLEEVTSVIHMLAGEGGGFINGQTIKLTGGLDWTG